MAAGAIRVRVSSKSSACRCQWETKRQAVLSQLERERSEPPREPTSGQVLHEAVLRAMLPGLEGLEGVGPEKAKQLMQARVNQSCSQFWGETESLHGVW